jgi:dihydrofolate synthase/folylpolyglutamate synthase
MCVNGKMVSDEQMLEVFEYFAPIVDQYDRWLESQNRRRVTFFEFTTAMAMQFFANQRCDAVVLETGLGGRLDSTNVCQPQLCIITNISLDHTKQLGNRLEKIAFEKSGIIKPNIPVVSGVVGPPSQAVVEDIAAQRSSPLVQRDREFWVEPTSQPSGQRKQIGGEDRFQFRMKSEPAQIYIEDLQTQMLGRHQWDNAALAIAAAIELRSAGWKIDNHAIRKGLADATLAGRMEQVNSRPVVIMDMAHNPASVAAFAAYLNQDKRFKTRDSRRSLVFATTREKDCEKMLAVLLPLFDRIVLTQYQNNPRAMPTQTMESICQKLGFSDRTFVKPTPLEAWEHVFLDASEDDFIGVAGSAFLLAELRSRVIAACQKRG